MLYAQTGWRFVILKSPFNYNFENLNGVGAYLEVDNCEGKTRFYRGADVKAKFQPHI